MYAICIVCIDFNHIIELYYLDVCDLPKSVGSCQGYYPTWYYDQERKQCAQFVYGGCLGNNNKFQTRDECEHICDSHNTLGNTIDSLTTIKLI